jgi:hypothetical protein
MSVNSSMDLSTAFPSGWQKRDLVRGGVLISQFCIDRPAAANFISEWRIRYRKICVARSLWKFHVKWKVWLQLIQWEGLETHMRPCVSFIEFCLDSSSLIKLINQLYAACLFVKLIGISLITKFPDVYRPWLYLEGPVAGT